MYQLGTMWKLWELRNVFHEETQAIQLRGFSSKPPVSLPSDFAMIEKRLSVEKIGSIYCPTRRDLYYQVKEKARVNKNDKTWGQAAGHIIEGYCKGILAHFADLAKLPNKLRYDNIKELAEEYTNSFWEDKKPTIDQLRKKSTNSNDSPERLIFLLKQTAKYELSLLGADFTLSRKRGRKFVSLVDSIPVKFDDNSLKITPSPDLGLSTTTTPDFIVLNKSAPVIGEVKSGIALKAFHLTTVAGFALAYESQYKVPVDFGIVYFVETHSSAMNFAQSYVFLIDDTIRKQFLLQRDRAYSILQQDQPPDVAEAQYYETACKHCAYHARCYPTHQS